MRNHFYLIQAADGLGLFLFRFPPVRLNVSIDCSKRDSDNPREYFN